MADQAGGGGKLGGRLTALVTQGLVATHTQLADPKRKLGALVLDDFFDKVSGEIRHTVGPLFAPLADHPNTPETMKPLFNFLARGQGQWQTFLGQTVAGSALGAGLGALFSNEMAYFTNPIIAQSPNIPLSAADAAKAEAARLSNGIDMAYEAAKGGISRDKFDVLVELSRSRPAPGEIVDLVNRGIVGEDYGRTMIERAGYAPDDAAYLLKLRRTVIDPARLADLVTFGVLTEDSAAPVAALSGMTREDFHYLVEGNGQPPSTQELLFAYRRGVIDKARLLRGVTQGPLRNEWFDVVESFGQVPMSTADAIEAYIKGHLSEGEARTIAQQNGLIPSQFDPLIQSAGSPPGPSEMLHLLNRGIMTEAEVTQGLKESRLNNKYISQVLQSRYELPTEAQILSMMRKGVITHARGRQLLQWRGYPPDIVEDLVAEATASTASTVKELSLTAIRDLYLNKTITQQEAQSRIVKLGFTAADADLELQLIDEQRARRYVETVITRIHREYVAGLLDDTEARADLNRLMVPADEISTRMDLWAIEKSTVRRSLTEAQVGQALKKGIITPDDAVARWQAMGYSADDTAILLGITAPAASHTTTSKRESQ